MADFTLTPEQERQAQEAFANRSFDPEEYQRNLCPEIPPEIQVELAEQTLRRDDPALLTSSPAPEDLDALARAKARADECAEEFCFLDPADFADKQANIGTPMTPLELWRALREECKLECWFSAADPAVIAKELNPRDVALAYRKIGQNPENLHDPKRWLDAIADIKQEEARRQPLCNYSRAGLQVCRKPGEPEYVTWIPLCTLREYSEVKFDSHGVPEFYIPGWRDVLLALIRKQLITEETADRVFGEATGVRSRRYKMILKSLRDRRYQSEPGETIPQIGETIAGVEAPIAAEPETENAIERCPECFWAFGQHQDWCPFKPGVTSARTN